MTAHPQLRVAMVVERFPLEPFLAAQVSALLERSVDVHVLCQIHDRTSELWPELAHRMAGRVHPWPDRGRTVSLVLSLAASASRVLVSAALRSPGRLRSAIAVERRTTDADSRFLGRLLFDARVLAIDPDVVHFQFGDLARERVHLAAAIDVGFTSSFRGYDLTYTGLDQPDFYDRLWPVLDGAHTLGQDLKRTAEARGCPASFDWKLIPPAVDLDRFGPPDRPSRTGTFGEPYRIVSVGRLHWKKGLSDGLAAIAMLRAKGHRVDYRIVGDGPDEERLRWTIADLGLADSVELIGHLDASGVREQMLWADVLLHPALTEGFGNAVLEAQAMGLPVVCTDAEGLAENVLHGETGLVVPRRTPAALTDAVLQLMADDGLGHRMGERGRQRVIDHFGIDAQTDAFVDFFTGVAERTGDKGKRR